MQTFGDAHGCGLGAWRSWPRTMPAISPAPRLEISGGKMGVQNPAKAWKDKETSSVTHEREEFNMNVQNKVIVITGGAGGIGSAQAKLLARNGAEVWILDLVQEKIDHAGGGAEASGRQGPRRRRRMSPARRSGRPS